MNNISSPATKLSNNKTRLSTVALKKHVNYII